VVTSISISKLATEAGTDVEEVLVSLWDAGIEDVEDPDDVVPLAQLKRARSVLGIESPRQQRTIRYWTSHLALSRDAFAALVGDLGIFLPPNARVLPKGALAKLRRQYAMKLSEGVAAEESLGPEPCPEFEWTIVGNPPGEICYLDETNVLDIHNTLVVDFAVANDPIFPPGLRSQHLLSSALSRQHTGMQGVLKYPTVELAAAALFHSLVMNHAFHNGNKRTAVVSMLVFLDKNGLFPTCDEKELFRLVLRVAQHGFVTALCSDLADREVHAIALWIRANSRKIEKGERPIPWLRLRRILRGFDCESEVSPNVGNRIRLIRRVERKGSFGRVRHETLSTHVAYGDDGREVARNTLNKIRHELQLDEAHGYDSRIFYDADALPDDFVQQYRMLLRRLGRV
jgi:death-on-curing family protein